VDDNAIPHESWSLLEWAGDQTDWWMPEVWYF